MNNASGDSLRETFLRWQCRVRQIVVREKGGCPDAAIRPTVILNDDVEVKHPLTTVLCKLPTYSKNAEMQHLFLRTHDPAERYNEAIRFFSECYYQGAHEFSDHLTASFLPGSQAVDSLCQAAFCHLTFSAYRQQFILHCQARRLAKDDFSYQATWWHNALFNFNLPADLVVIGFYPDWKNSHGKVLSN